MFDRKLLLAIAGLALMVSACAPQQEAAAPDVAPEPEAEVVEEIAAAPTAVAVLTPRADSEVSGTVTFSETAAGVEIVADIARVTPGLHGLHLHELGDCSAADFTSTGGHFNPSDAPHGGPGDEVRHAGDFGNIEIGEDGAGRLVLVTDRLTVSDGPDTVVGRAVILHEVEDDLTSQPTGAAGGRIGCGIVILEGEEMMDDLVAASDEGESED